MNKLTFNRKSSLRNSIVLAFFLVILIGGIFINTFILTFVKSELLGKGWDSTIVEHFIQELTFYSSGATLGGVIVVLIVSILISRAITRPLNQLTTGMMNIAEGKWSTRIDINSQDEIGHLADGFNFMARHVENSLLKIEAAKDFTDNLILSVPSILVVLSNRMKPISANAAFDRFREQYPSLKIDHFINLLNHDIELNLKNGKTTKKEISVVPENMDITLIFSAIITRIGEDNIHSDEEKPSVLITITDITARKKMKELVLQSKQDWEDTFNTIPDIITIHDSDYNIVQANKAAQEHLDLPFLSPDTSNKCFKYYHGTDAPPDDCLSCECMVNGQFKTFEIYEPHLKKYIELRSIPRLNARQELIGVIHIARDITDRKIIEENHNKLMDEITRAKIEWEATFDSIEENIILIDKDLQITRCNRSFSRYIGKPVNTLIGVKLEDYFPGIYEHVTGQIESDESEAMTVKKEILTETGRWLYVTLQPIVDDSAQALHSILIATDITDLKTAEKKLAESEEELKMKVDDLEKFYDMAVGRELRMKELKGEIKRLSAQISDSMQDNASAG